MRSIYILKIFILSFLYFNFINLKANTCQNLIEQIHNKILFKITNEKDINPFLYTPKNIAEYKAIVSLLKIKNVGKYHIQTLRERLLIKRKDVEIKKFKEDPFKKMVIIDYLKNLGFEIKKLESIESLFETVDIFHHTKELIFNYGPKAEFPIKITQKNIYKNNYSIEIMGVINGGRFRTLSYIEFKLEKNNTILNINQMFTLNGLRKLGLSKEILDILFKEYPNISRIKGSFVQTNLKVFLESFKQKNLVKDLREQYNNIEKVKIKNDDNSKLAQEIREALAKTPTDKTLSKYGFKIDFVILNTRHKHRLVDHINWVKAKISF